MFQKTKAQVRPFLASTCLFLFGCASSPSNEASTLRVGVSADFAPICFMEDGQLKGFDIDLMNALAQRMQMKIKWFDFPFDTLIPELLTGKIHLCVGGMSLTKERGEKVLFSHVYLKEGSIVALMKKDSPWASSHDWKTAKILVCMGYTSSDDYVTQQLKLEPVRLNNLIDCVLALRAAQGDVLVGPSNSIEHLIKSDRDQWSMYTLKSNQSEGCVCLISKKYPHLQEPLNKALTELETEGYMEALKKKWGLYD